MKPDSGESRNKTAAATSAAWPVRPSGVLAMFTVRKLSGAASVIGVSMKPGLTRLTRMPRSPSCMLADRVRPRRAHLLAV